MCGCGCSRCGNARREPAGVPGELDIVRHSTGRNYSIAGVRQPSTVSTPLTLTVDEDHVHEPVRFSAWGRAMKSHAATLAPQHAPIPFFHGFRGFITNGVRVPGGIHPPVTFAQPYDGVTPLLLQPTVNKPYPYTMPRYAPGVSRARNIVNDAELQGIVQRPV